MFKIYDLNMKEIPFPDGVMPLEIFIGSVGKNRATDTVDGRPGVVDYGFNYTDRPVSLFLRIKAADKIDFRLLRNEVFAMFDIGNAFYVAETDVPSRVLKVVVDESYIPDRLTEEYADFDINCRTLDSVFWESIYTTLELHDSGYSAIAEKYGLVDNIDDEKVKYRFEPETDYQPNLIPLTESAWEEGGWYTTNGAANATPGRIRTKAQNSIEVIEGETYTFRDDSVYTSAINNIYILHYRDGQYIGSSRGWELVKRRGSLTFNARGNEIRLSLLAKEGFGIRPNFITDGRVIMKLEPGEKHTGYIPESLSLTVYNAGNVTIEPEYSFLEIVVNGLHSPEGFTLTNRTTGDSFALNRSIEGSNLGIRGMIVNLEGITNIFRDTNREFISLDPGDNVFEITGGTFKDISINFKYLYK